MIGMLNMVSESDRHVHQFLDLINKYVYPQFRHNILIL